MAASSSSTHIRVEGRVQGVGFRQWAAARAGDLGLTGWVRNRRDGSVEAVFSGPAEKVGKMIESCRRGPLDAVVSTVEIIGEGAAAYPTFTIERTD